MQRDIKIFQHFEDLPIFIDPNEIFFKYVYGYARKNNVKMFDTM